jgi:tetratricopeptide (TPR) repeat protein
MDPLRSDVRPAEALSGTERDARIEQLLLAGLDEYFAQRYEHAINLWTRVLFLDRQHDRARAYIERARRAQAERQRESEAALHQAVDAFHAGDVVRARELVTDALDRGASPDEAHGMLERIERLGVAQTSPRARRRLPLSSVAWPSVPSTSIETTQGRSSRRDHPRASRRWSPAVLLASAAMGVLAVAAWGVTTPEPAAWWIFSSPEAVNNRTVPWSPEPLPMAEASEFYLARARALFASGRVRDALSVLDRIPLGDPLRPEADRLRADVQQQLLTLAITERPPE